MSNDLKNNIEDNEISQEVIETVELTIEPLVEGTIITLTDPDGFDQSPVPQIQANSDNYYIDKICVNGKERQEAYFKKYSTLEFYKDETVVAGNTYTVFGRVKSKPGYIFYDPVNLIVNGEELSSQEVEDYSLEQDSFTFYFDLKAVNK